MPRVRSRTCSRTGCAGAAVSTLTYVYSESVAVLGPLAVIAEPGSYDLCATHMRGLSAPRGWEVIRLPIEATTPGPSHDDLLALADAVREIGLGLPAAPAPAAPAPIVELRRKGHLAVLADPGN